MVRRARQAGRIPGPVIRHAIAALGLVLISASAFGVLGTQPVTEPAAAPEAPDADDVDRSDNEGGKILGPTIEPPAAPDDPSFTEDPNGDTDEDEPARIPAEDIDIQVLDGYREDGGTAATAVAAELRELGYVIAAENPAIAYEETTVLWSEGYEAEARQVAEDLGGTPVREQPGNLSAQVKVHVVVGADRG